MMRNFNNGQTSSHDKAATVASPQSIDQYKVEPGNFGNLDRQSALEPCAAPLSSYVLL